MREFVFGLGLQLWTAMWLCGKVVLQESHVSPDLPVREVKLCNGSFNGSLLDGPIALSLPPLQPSVTQPIFCRYSFTGVDPYKVSLKVTRLQAGVYNNGSQSCSGGYLRIWDGDREPGRHLYPANTLCGSYDNSELNLEKISTRAHAAMEFYSSHVGYVASLRVIVRYIDIEKDADKYEKQIKHSMQLVANTASVCYWRVQLEDCDHECPLISPGYPGIYPPNTECYYHVTSNNPNVNLQLKSTGMTESGKMREFNLRHSCGKNYLDVYDHASDKDPSLRIGHFCGQYLPSITTSSNNIFLVFSSGDDTPPYSYTGFHISAVGVTKEWHQDGYHQPDSICGWVFNSSAGSVSSPEHWLPPQSTCEYGFHVSDGYYLEVIINVYGLDRNCRDYIIVMDDQRVINKICDDVVRQSRETFIFNLTSSYVVVRYHTSSGQMEGEQSRGFWLSFRQIYDPKPPELSTESPEKPQPVVHYEVVNTASPLLRHTTCLPRILLVPLLSICISLLTSSQ